MVLKPENKRELYEKLKTFLYLYKRGEIVKAEDRPFNSLDDIFSGIKINKTGKDISIALERLQDTLKRKIKALKPELIVLTKQINATPQGVGKILDPESEIPLVYSYDQIYNDTTYGYNGLGMQMEKYNRLAFEYTDLLLYSKKIDRVVESLQMDKDYIITPNLATRLSI